MSALAFHFFALNARDNLLRQRHRSVRKKKRVKSVAKEILKTASTLYKEILAKT